MKEDILLKLLDQATRECKHYAPVFKGGFFLVDMRAKDHRRVYRYSGNYLLFVLSGTIRVTFDRSVNHPIRRHEMYFLAKNTEVQIRAEEDVRLLILKYSPNGQLNCVHAAAGRLYKCKQRLGYMEGGVAVKPEMLTLVGQVVHYLKTGLICPHMHIIKQHELYLIFKDYYTDEEKVALFHASQWRASGFMEAVLENYMNVKTAEEFASMLGYGIKTFRKLFLENFGKTPYKWMQEQTAKQIKAKLMDENIPLKQIMFDFRFTTSSHFNYYCKKHFGDTPMQIRKLGQTEQ